MPANEKPTNLLQISVSRSAELKALVPAHCTSLKQRAEDLEAIQKHMAVAIGGAEPSFAVHDRISPHAIAVSEPLLARLELVHVLLGRAFSDIAARWFSDKEAAFPQRMPLNPAEESLLRWVIDSQLRHSQPLSGCWRTDVLFGASPDGKEDEHPYVCEVNSRICLNGVLMTGLHGTTAGQLSLGTDGIQFPETYEQSIARIAAYFDHEKPLFVVRDQWPGVDSKVFQDAYIALTGQPAYTVRPADLQARQDKGAPTGYSLWDSSTELKLEQWACEMFQDEWASLPETIARQLALTPLNDVRTIFLLHDKRLLGILLDEIPGMISREVLTKEEAETLAGSIPQTLIPGSPGLCALLEECRRNSSLKDAYLYKSCREGSCKGVELGRNLSQEEWLNRMERLAGSQVLRPDQDTAVVQRMVEHHWYDIVRHDVPGVTGPAPERFHLIGSMYMWDSQRFHLGPWRLGDEVHIGIKVGTVTSALKRPNWPYRDQAEH